MQNSNAYFINVFMDKEGAIQESEDGIMNTEGKALIEAITYVLDHGWTYVDTLSNYSHPINFSEQIKDAQFEHEHPDHECTRRQYEDMMRKQIADVTGIPFRPQPTRGTAPTNPNTLTIVEKL